MKTNLNDLACSWAKIQSIAEDTNEYAEHEWALRELGNLIALEPIQAWHVVESIYEANKADSWVIENLGAGPVETMLRMHGSAVLPLLSLYFSANEEFKDVLKHVWIHSLPPEISNQLSKIVK
ncbi:hypothetical protein JR065_18770 [Xanthomonas sp. AmX2]|uniref:DUF6869 domain-containing protein n=1 Tax=Xanthomonas sp. TaxID=29446 RepID=UPI00197CF4D4|nr:hypothetical protein [Xanthomonas sp.]MBN6152387.1 hypothetical protein [Xanthomonas sp.]